MGRHSMPELDPDDDPSPCWACNGTGGSGETNERRNRDR